MLSLLQTFGWLACVIYSTIPSFWLLIHPRAESWRSRRRSPYRILLPLWMAMWIVVAVATAPWRRFTFYSEPALWIPAVLLFATGMWLYRASARGFTARQLGGIPELNANHPEQRLVTSGIRSHVRHPVYLAHLLEMLAWSLGTGLLVCYSLTALAIFTGAIMIRMEDAELERRFGDEYASYRRRIPSVIPRFRSTQ